MLIGLKQKVYNVFSTKHSVNFYFMLINLANNAIVVIKACKKGTEKIALYVCKKRGKQNGINYRKPPVAQQRYFTPRVYCLFPKTFQAI